jgi:hypothetical protein
LEQVKWQSDEFFAEDWVIWRIARKLQMHRLSFLKIGTGGHRFHFARKTGIGDQGLTCLAGLLAMEDLCLSGTWISQRQTFRTNDHRGQLVVLDSAGPFLRY